jgi:hypothetical protein
MVLTQEKIKELEDWSNGLWNDINAHNVPYSQKKYLNELHNSVKKDDAKINNNNNNNKPNYYQNYYGSNNVQIIGNNNNVGTYGMLF